MTLYRTLLAVAVSATLLTACNKTEAPAEQPANTAETTQTAPAETASVNLDGSPSIAMMNKILQMSTLMHLAQTNPDITEEQGACLMSKDGEATYHETSKQMLVDAVGVEGIQEADKFYESEVGQKVLKYTEQQEKLARGESIDGEPIVIAEEDQAQMIEMGPSEANQKLEAAMQESITPEKMKTLIEDFAIKEKARCNIS